MNLNARIHDLADRWGIDLFGVDKIQYLDGVGRNTE
jgi:hypothetical protein